MVIKTIKNVDEEIWRSFKVLAARTGINMAVLLGIMVREFEKNNSKFWNSILGGKKFLSDGEANDIITIVGGLRKERGFRI